MVYFSFAEDNLQENNWRSISTWNRIIELRYLTNDRVPLWNFVYVLCSYQEAKWMVMNQGLIFEDCDYRMLLHNKNKILSQSRDNIRSLGPASILASGTTSVTTSQYIFFFLFSAHCGAPCPADDTPDVSHSLPRWTALKFIFSRYTGAQVACHLS